MMPTDAYILLFMFFGLSLVGIASLVIAVYIAIQSNMPEPKTNWERSWTEIEEDLSK